MPDSIWATFGPWLQNERERSGVSQGKVAEKADLHVIQLSRIENGKSGIKRPTLMRIVTAINQLSVSYKVDINEALKRAGFASLKDTDPYGLYSGMDKLSPEMQELAKRQIKAILDSLAAQDDHDTDYIDDDA